MCSWLVIDKTRYLPGAADIAKQQGNHAALPFFLCVWGREESTRNYRPW